MSDPKLYPHVRAIIDQLEAAGLRVGNHQAPKSTDGKIVAPCVVVWMTPSPMLTGSIDRPPVDTLLRFRVTAVAHTADGAADLADQVFDVLNGAELEVPDRAIFRMRRSSLASIERDDDVTPPLFYAPTPYQLMSVAAIEEES